MMPRNFGLHPKDPVEIVNIEAPVIAQAIAVILFIGMIAVWCVILGDKHTPSCAQGSVAALFTDCDR